MFRTIIYVVFYFTDELKGNLSLAPCWTSWPIQLTRSAVNQWWAAWQREASGTSMPLPAFGFWVWSWGLVPECGTEHSPALQSLLLAPSELQVQWEIPLHQSFSYHQSPAAPSRVPGSDSLSSDMAAVRLLCASQIWEPQFTVSGWWFKARNNKMKSSSPYITHWKSLPPIFCQQPTLFSLIRDNLLTLLIIQHIFWTYMTDYVLIKDIYLVAIKKIFWKFMKSFKKSSTKTNF